MRRKKFVLLRGTPFETSYYLIQGYAKGPVCMITAGIHGKEIGGILAAQALLNQRIHRGTLLIVPIVNNQAFLNRIRGNPDLNRTFPKTRHDSARHPLAKHLLQLANKYRPTLCMDLHEATGFSKVDPRKLGQSFISSPGSASIPTAKHVLRQLNRSISLNRQFTLKTSILPGSFRTAAERVLKCPTVTIETSMNMPLIDRVNYHQQVVDSFLRELKIL